MKHAPLKEREKINGIWGSKLLKSSAAFYSQEQ
jgi:hypothetical protein